MARTVWTSVTLENATRLDLFGLRLTSDQQVNGVQHGITTKSPAQHERMGIGGAHRLRRWFAAIVRPEPNLLPEEHTNLENDLHARTHPIGRCGGAGQTI